MVSVVAASLALFAAGCAQAMPASFDGVRDVLSTYVSHRAFPGAVALVGKPGQVLWSDAVGNFTYGEHPAPQSHGTNPPMTVDTPFDLASVTKVVATTTATMLLYERGLLHLDTHITAYLGPGYAAAGKGIITIEQLLTHSAGYPPDPNPNYWFPQFGCPATTKLPNPPQDFSCQDKIFQALLAQTLDYTPGTKYVYSDLSMITMMYVIGAVTKSNGIVTEGDLRPGCDQGGPGAIMCYYEAFVARDVIGKLGMRSTGFLPDESLWPSIPPAWNDTTYQKRVIQGTVSDGNAYALGGISGHAGLFSTVGDIFTLVSALMNAPASGGFVNATTVAKFTTVADPSLSSRALGWDTNAANNDYVGCSTMSQRTFTHLGYTGTEICADPDAGVIHILLTNRVYPSVNDEPLIHAARIAFNTAAVLALQN